MSMERPIDSRYGSVPARGRPKKAPEGLLLVVLLISVLLTVMSLLVTRHPAAGVFAPISEETGN